MLSSTNDALCKSFICQPRTQRSRKAKRLKVTEVFKKWVFLAPRHMWPKFFKALALWQKVKYERWVPPLKEVQNRVVSIGSPGKTGSSGRALVRTLPRRGYPF